MSCEDESHPHDHHSHEHSGGHGGHGHDGHSHEVPLSSGPQDSLYGVIDLPHVTALNAAGGAESGQRVIKPWDLRDDETLYCESDADDTLILNIPFNASVSLRSLTIKAGPSGQTPSALHLYKDSPGMDFNDVDKTPTQVLEMVEERQGVEYQVKASKWTGMSNLTIYIPGNTSDGEEDTTRVYYIGLRGSHQALPSRPGVIIYESAARPQDHPLQGVKEGGTFHQGY